MFDASTLRHRIIFRREADVDDGKGGYTRAWTNLAVDVPAKVESLNGREMMIARSLQGINTYRITVRFREDLKPSDQIKLANGDELNITAVGDPDGKRTRTEIYATSETPQGA